MKAVIDIPNLAIWPNGRTHQERAGLQFLPRRNCEIDRATVTSSLLSVGPSYSRGSNWLQDYSQEFTRYLPCLSFVGTASDPRHLSKSTAIVLNDCIPNSAFCASLAILCGSGWVRLSTVPSIPTSRSKALGKFARKVGDLWCGFGKV